jgi:hypothetical protein
MIDYLANLGANRSTLAGFSVKKYGAQQSTDPWNPDAGNGVSSATGKNITGNSPFDTGVTNSTAIRKHQMNTTWRATAGRRYWRHVETSGAAGVLAAADRGTTTEWDVGAGLLSAAPDRRI